VQGIGEVDAVSVAARFNDCINTRDVDRLAALMSDDHAFIDSEGAVVSGRQAVVEAWRGFFDAFPDYRNVFTSLTASDDVVTIVGHSTCSEPSLAGPALWSATVRGGRVHIWRVFADTPAAREQLGLT
jgi:ketosteroid isomerase-like protein